MSEMQDIIWGRHPVEEAMEVGGRVRRIMVALGAREYGLAELLDLAQKLHVVVEQVPRERLDQLTRNANHQGVIALVKPW
ncbi:MAG: 23S rRNA (guanosine(2251)-2'-O)-methyltransferase RlmB, partial [Ktedonobacterales bacterium]|nr:23S rRNA (guanosine(2251)-2'-O)-methyltransferase RlmB [Ktedonobacterales bacterium]